MWIGAAPWSPLGAGEPSTIPGPTQASAPPASALGEAELGEKELGARREALKTRIFEPLILEARSFRLSFERTTSAFVIDDRQTGIGWHSSLLRKGFAALVLRDGGRILPVDQTADLRFDAKEIRFRGRSTRGDLPEVRFRLRILEPLVGLEFSFEIPKDGAALVDRVLLLDGGPWVADADGGGAVIPRGLGEWISAAGPEVLRRRLRRLDGPWSPGDTTSPEPATLGALGLVRGGAPATTAALLIAWTDPAAELEVRRGPSAAPGLPGRQELDFTLGFGGPTGAVRLYPLGKGDQIEMSHSHRQLVIRDNASPNLRTKIADREDLQSILGAAIFRPRISGPGPGGKPRILLPFDDLAQAAEHWQKVLMIDQALVILDGWSAREAGEAGGPFQAAAAAGGQKALADLGRKLKDLGFLFGLRVDTAEGLEEALPALASGPAPQLLVVPSESLLALKPRAAEGSRPAAPPAPAAPAAPTAPSAPAKPAITAPEGDPGPPPDPIAASVLPPAAADLLGKIRAAVGLAGTDGAGEAWIAPCAYVESLLSDKVLQPGGERIFPLFSFSYGHSVRMAVRPVDAVGPDQPARFLACLAAGEVPVYALEARAAAAPAASGGSPAAPDPRDPRWCLARSDGGWAEGKGLTPWECFLKNTFEAVSHMERLRYRSPLLFRRFLDGAATVEETWFGEDLRIVVNFGPKDYTDEEGQFTLPPSGFWIQHPNFHAFHATKAHGIEYETPALFTVRSLEGKMYLRAESVRIYHGFGPAKIQLGGRTFEIAREGIVKIW